MSALSLSPKSSVVQPPRPISTLAAARQTGRPSSTSACHPMSRVRLRSRTLSLCTTADDFQHPFSVASNRPSQIDVCNICDLIYLACTRIQTMSLEHDEIQSICHEMDSVCISESLSNLNTNVREIGIKLKQLSTLEMSELIDRLCVTFNGSHIRSPEDKDCDMLTEVLQKLNMESSTDVMTDCVGSLEDLTLDDTSDKFLINSDMCTVCSLLYYLMAQQRPEAQMIENFMQRLTIL